jgi:hypothetical protein
MATRRTKPRPQTERPATFRAIAQIVEDGVLFVRNAYVEGYTPSQIAKATGISALTVQQIVGARRPD